MTILTILGMISLVSADRKYSELEKTSCVIFDVDKFKIINDRMTE